MHICSHVRLIITIICKMADDIHIILNTGFSLPIHLYYYLHLALPVGKNTYPQIQTLHKPLISKEIASHVNITIVNEATNFAGKVLVLWLHCVILSLEVHVDLITVDQIHYLISNLVNSK